MEERISNRSIWISSLSLQHLLGCLFLAFACMLVLSLQHLLDCLLSPAFACMLVFSSICLVVCSLSTAFAWRDLIVKINREGGKCILCEHTFIQDCVRTFHIQCLLEQIELVSSFLFAQIDTRFHYTESAEELAAIFFWWNKLAKLRRHASRVNFIKLHFE